MDIPAHKAWSRPPTAAEVAALELGISPPADIHVSAADVLAAAAEAEGPAVVSATLVGGEE